MRASGSCGELRVGYQIAAELGAWSIVLEERLPRTYAFLATVKRTHEYWSTQRPIDLVLALSNVEWVWRDVEPQIASGEIRIELHDRPIVSERLVQTQLNERGKR